MGQSNDDDVPTNPYSEGQPSNFVIGALVGRFQIKSHLGQGGMGDTWLAHDPSRNIDVVLKTLLHHQGDGDDQRRSRFERESRLMSRIKSPNIVHVYEAHLERSPPYIVMEFVPGKALNKLLDKEGRLSAHLAAKYVQQAAVGLQAIHDSGITHRDLKPSNLILSSESRVKIIDFGLAKDQSDPFLTRPGEFVGTPIYLAPEVIHGAKADERADIYSLGATLYHLITGHPPFPGTTLEVLSQKKEGKQPLPPRALRSDISSELETVTLKALRREREARYRTAQDFADDLQRYLDGVPVKAREHGTFENLSFFIRRKLKTIAVVTFVLLAILGMAAMALRKREESRIEASLRATAERQTEGINRFWQASLERIRAEDRAPDAPEPTLQELADAAARQLEEGNTLADQPVTRAEMHSTIGLVYQNLGKYEAAAHHARASLDLFRANLGPEKRATLRAMNNLGVALTDLEKPEEAEWTHRECLAVRERVFGSKDEDTLYSKENLAYALEAQEDRKLPEAENLLRDCLKGRSELSGPDHPETADVQAHLAMVLAKRQNQEEAEPLLAEALRVLRAHHSEINPRLLSAENTLSCILRDQGKLARAEEITAAMIPRAVKAFGVDSTNYLVLATNHCTLLRKLGRTTEAEQRLRPLLAAMDRVPSAEDTVKAKAMQEMGRLLLDTSRPAEAEPLCRAAWKINLDKLGRDDWRTASCENDLGDALRQQKRPAEAEPHLRESLQMLRKSTNTPRDQLQGAFERLIKILEETGNLDEARKLRQDFKDLSLRTEPT